MCGRPHRQMENLRLLNDAYSSVADVDPDEEAG